MAARAKQFVFDAATRELWRVAESGDTDALPSILSRGVDINARNEHGMTALMRAAHNGHEQMVRALLEHGADPNTTRNDKFTALALAAFFGHTETVRILIESGAKTEVVTRSGTSPKMWATARTFTEAARCLEQPKPKAPVVPIAIAAVAKQAEIKTLKDPPEIWDLVREEPRGFNAGSAFVSRVKSMRKTFAFGALAALILLVACGVGALVLRSTQARNLPAELPPIQISADATVSHQINVESSTPIAPPAETDEFLSAHAVKKTPVTRQTRRHPVADDNVIETAPSREAPPAPAEVATPQFEKPKTESAAKSTPTTLSPQLITPVKSASPKAKVIQWP
ncbi:MAG TPA: ankyrin repeat domain-containing protein [Pyrinomonadaceae bacterium]|nr:ankyrin repeat domain-containing protein [Pyrinomonadaceae bacterium]